MRQVQIEIVADAAELAERAVRLFVVSASEAIAVRGVFAVALSGGRTPELFLRRLAEESLEWDKVHVFWVDERYVPSDSSASNYRLASEALLSRIKIPATNVHRIPTEHPDPAEAACAYERTIREVFGLPAQGDPCPVSRNPQFDLIVLGLGPDGHTASLFPSCVVPGAPCERDSPTQDAGRATHDAPCPLVAAVHVAGVTPPDRITLTPVVLRAARRLLVLVSGREKAPILREVLTSEPDEARYPIHVLWPVLDRVAWLVDREAAGEIGEA